MVVCSNNYKNLQKLDRKIYALAQKSNIFIGFDRFYNIFRFIYEFYGIDFWITIRKKYKYNRYIATFALEGDMLSTYKFQISSIQVFKWFCLWFLNGRERRFILLCCIVYIARVYWCCGIVTADRNGSFFYGCSINLRVPQN